MKRLTDQLDRDSLLVLHAAGELPPDDARHAEALLAADPALRTDYDALWHTLRSADEALAAGDAVTPLPLDPRVCERRIGRMIREWAALRPERPPTVVQKVVGLKYPWWTYPLTAAAAVILAFLVWWGHTPLRNTPYANNASSQTTGDDAATTEPTTPDDQTQLADDLEQSFTHPGREHLRTVEGQLYALTVASASEDDDAAPAPPQQQQEVNQ